MRFVRIKLHDPNQTEDADLAPSSRLCIRFIRNFKFSDFFARNEVEHSQWVEVLSQVMIRTDFHLRFTIQKQIGEGSFAKVYLGTNKETGASFAVKAFSKEFLSSQDKGKDSIKNEIEILTTLKHTNVIRLVEVNESVNSLYLVLEYLQGGNLSDFLRNSTQILTEQQIVIIMR